MIKSLITGLFFYNLAEAHTSKGVSSTHNHYTSDQKHSFTWNSQSQTNQFSDPGNHQSQGQTSNIHSNIGISSTTGHRNLPNGHTNIRQDQENYVFQPNIVRQVISSQNSVCPQNFDNDLNDHIACSQNEYWNGGACQTYNPSCMCIVGYCWNSNRGQCIKQTVVSNFNYNGPRPLDESYLLSQTKNSKAKNGWINVDNSHISTKGRHHHNSKHHRHY